MFVHVCFCFVFFVSAVFEKKKTEVLKQKNMNSHVGKVQFCRCEALENSLDLSYSVRTHSYILLNSIQKFLTLVLHASCLTFSLFNLSFKQRNFKPAG